MSPALGRVLITRGAVVWLLCRLLVTGAAVATSRGVTRTPRLAPVAVAWILVVCATLALVDLRRRHERLLLANLGISRLQAVCWCLAPAALGESAILAIWPG